MRKYLYTALLFCCIIPIKNTFAQKSTLSKANKFMATHSYSRAITLYNFIINNSEEANISAKTKLAECYTVLDYYDEAESLYVQLIDSVELDAYHIFNYALVLKSNGKYDEAKKWFLKYNKVNPNDNRTEKMILSCDLAPVMIKDSFFYEIERFPFFNSSASESAPAFYNNKIAFSSNRNGDHIDEFTGDPYLDMYYIEKEGDDKWSPIKKFPPNINTKLHDGPASFNKEGNVMYITRMIPKAKKKELSKFQIVKAENINGKWEISEKFLYNSKVYSVGHPSLSADGSKLYFISDMPGGYGGKDIYVSYYKDDNWSVPENLGPAINTEGDEVFPFIHSDSILYFSSDGHLGLGGVDIFVSLFKNNKWTIPQNLGYPINSPREDFGFIIDEDQEKGYLSSNRTNGGLDDDIYYFEKIMPIFEDCDTMTGRSLCVVLFESDSADLDSLPLIYEWVLGDGNVKRGNAIEHCYAEAGIYKVLLNVINSDSSETVFNEATYELIVEEYPDVFINSVDTILVNTSFVFDGSESLLDNCDIKKYYWTFMNEITLEGKKVEYFFEKPGVYHVQLGIYGRSNSLANSCLKCIYKKIIVQKP